MSRLDFQERNLYFGYKILKGIYYNLFLNITVPTRTEIAQHTGYNDQMHFIKDFKEFAKNTPQRSPKEKIRFHPDWESD